MVIPLIGLILNPNIVVDKILNYFPNFEFLNIISDVNYTSYIFYFLVIFFLLFLFKNIFIFIYFYLQNKFVQKVDVDLDRGKVLIIYDLDSKINFEDIKRKITSNGQNATELQILKI